MKNKEIIDLSEEKINLLSNDELEELFKNYCTHCEELKREYETKIKCYEEELNHTKKENLDLKNKLNKNTTPSIFYLPDDFPLIQQYNKAQNDINQLNDNIKKLNYINNIYKQNFNITSEYNGKLISENRELNAKLTNAQNIIEKLQNKISSLENKKKEQHHQYKIFPDQSF